MKYIKKLDKYQLKLKEKYHPESQYLDSESFL